VIQLFWVPTLGALREGMNQPASYGNSSRTRSLKLQMLHLKTTAFSTSLARSWEVLCLMDILCGNSLGIGADPVDHSTVVKIGNPLEGQRRLELFHHLHKQERPSLEVVPLLGNLLPQQTRKTNKQKFQNKTTGLKAYK